MDRWHSYIGNVKSFYSSSPIYIQTLFQILAIIFISLICWLILSRILKIAEKKLQTHEFVKTNHQIFLVLRRILLFSLLLASGSFLIRFFNVRLLENLFYAGFIILLANPVNRFIHITINYLKEKIADQTDTKVDNIIFDLIAKFSDVIIYIIAIVLALDILGINVMPFVAGAGVVGIAVGFAAKDTLSNLIAGVLLIIDRPFEVGDRIEVWSAPIDSATWGDVIDIGLRATKIKTTDNIVIIIPNNEIMKRDIVNYTIITSKIRVRINIGVAYDTDIEKAKRIIMQTAESVQWISKEPAPKVVVRNFGESSVDLQLRVWIDDARKRMDTISHITDKVKEAFDKSDIEIPYPKRDIIITQKQT